MMKKESEEEKLKKPMKRMLRRTTSFILMMLLLMSGLNIPQIPVVKAAAAGNVIAIAYDNSGSMISEKSDAKDRWCQALYATEIFSSMMLESDTMRIYPLNTGDGRPEYIELKGSSSADERKKQIESYNYGAGGTPYKAVDNAYKYLNSAPADQNKWLVVLTDGAFDDIKADAVNANFKKYAANGVKVAYLRILDGTNVAPADKIKNDNANNIYANEAVKSSDTLDLLLNYSNLIFTRQALSNYDGVLKKNADSIEINLDTPVEQIIVFAQGENISIGDMTGGQSVKQVEKIEIKTPGVPSWMAAGKYGLSDSFNPANVKVAAGLGGTVATFKADGADCISAGTYKVPVSNTKNVEIYCKLAVDIDLEISQDGKPVEDDGNVFEGEFEANVIYKGKDGTILTGKEKLLSKAKKNIKLINTDVNGKATEIDISDPSYKGAFVKGSLEIGGSVDFEDSSIQVSNRKWKVIENVGSLTIEVGLPQGPDNSSEFYLDRLADKESYLTIRVKESGQLISAEHADQLKLQITTDKNVELLLEKTDEAGVYRVYPFYKGSMAETDYGVIPYKVTGELEIDGQVQKAEVNGSFEIVVANVDSAITPEEDKHFYILHLPVIGKKDSTDGLEVSSLDGEEPLVLTCTKDGELFTPEEWENVQIEGFLYDNKEAQTIDPATGEAFQFKFIKGEGKDASKVFVVPATTKGLIARMIFLKSADVYYRIGLKYEFAGESARCVTTDKVVIDRLSWADFGKFWIPALIVIAVILFFFLGYTFCKAYNIPHPRFIKEEWTRADGTHRTQPTPFSASVDWLTLIIPYKAVEWTVDPGMTGVKSLYLRSIRGGGYELLNYEDLANPANSVQVLKNSTKLDPAAKKHTINESDRFTFKVTDQRLHTLKYDVKLKK